MYVVGARARLVLCVVFIRLYFYNVVVERRIYELFSITRMGRLGGNTTVFCGAGDSSYDRYTE